MNCIIISIWMIRNSMKKTHTSVNNMSLQKKLKICYIMNNLQNVFYWIWLHTPVYKIDGFVNGSGTFTSGVFDFAGFDENRIYDCNWHCCLIDRTILFDIRSMFTPWFQYSFSFEILYPLDEITNILFALYIIEYIWNSIWTTDLLILIEFNVNE